MTMEERMFITAAEAMRLLSISDYRAFLRIAPKIGGMRRGRNQYVFQRSKLEGNYIKYLKTIQ